MSSGSSGVGPWCPFLLTIVVFVSLCLYQNRRCCLVILSQLSGFVCVLVVGSEWCLNPWVFVVVCSWLE